VDLNLDTLKREMLEYLDSSGFAVFHGCAGALDRESMILWDTERHPDYQAFLQVALKTESRVIIFASREFEASDVENLLGQLDDLDLDREDKRDYEKRLRAFRGHEGVTCSLELAFDYHSRLYIYEMQPDWYEEYLNVEEEILALISDEAVDGDGDDTLGGFYSKN
jgi:hypothetical protein